MVTQYEYIQLMNNILGYPSDDLAAVADKALYRAKQDGGNRVEVGNTRVLG